MTSTRSNPRIGQSSSALTSLGAVGGPRGTAAGALRVLIEFLTEYDPTAIKQLESDLGSLTQLEEQLGQKQIKVAQQVANARQKVAQAEALQAAKLAELRVKSEAKGRASASDLRRANLLRQTGAASDLREARALEQRAFDRFNLTTRERAVLNDIARAKGRQAGLEAKLLALQKQQLATQEQQASVSSELSAKQGIAGGLGSKLSGLAIGAVGGLVGGAVLGVGFAAAQAAIDAVGEALLNVIDPARQAREALEPVAQAIISIQEANQDMTTEQAAASYLKSIGVTAGPATAQLLATASAAEKAKQFVDAYMQSGLVASQSDALYQEQVKRLTDQLYSEAKAAFDAKANAGQLTDIMDTAAIRAEAEAEAIYRISNAEQIAADEADRLAARQDALQKNLEATALIAQFAAQQLENVINAGAETAFINPIQDKINALQNTDSESAKTKGLQAKIDALQNQGQGGGKGKNQELANIAEERELILLRQKLRLLGTNIDLEKYEGKFLLEAIDAKIKALQKQADAQDRLNKELDLQFRMSQVLRRQEGESINDFLERRAQNNRDLLQEQQKLEQEKIIESLNDQKEKVQDEVALAALAEKQKNAISKGGVDNRLRNLQRELAASKKADQEALAARIKTLQALEAKQKEAAQNAAHYASVVANEEIRQAARAANSVEKIATLSGEARGLSAAKSFLEALLSSGVLRPNEVAQVKAAIARISSTLNAIGDAEYNVMKNALQGKGPPIAFASGGYIPLNAGSTPFGRNARFGEHGTEAGMLVVPTSALNKARNGRGEGMFGDVVINRSQDPYRDQYLFKQAIREVVREELRH